jgi:hypothetical protein
VHDLIECAKQHDSRDWVHGRVADWADESLEVGRRAYLVPNRTASIRSGAVLGREYERENLPRAVERLARSGVRLAALLNEILR